MNLSKISGLPTGDKSIKKGKSVADSSAFEEFMKIDTVGEAELEKQKKQKLKTKGSKASGESKKAGAAAAQSRPLTLEEENYDASLLDFIDEGDGEENYGSKLTLKAKPTDINFAESFPKKLLAPLNLVDQKWLFLLLNNLPAKNAEELIGLCKNLSPQSLKMLIPVLHRMSLQEISQLVSEQSLGPEDKDKNIFFALSEEELKKKGSFTEVKKKPISDSRFLFFGIKEKKKEMQEFPEEEEEEIPIQQKKQPTETKKSAPPLYAALPESKKPKEALLEKTPAPEKPLAQPKEKPLEKITAPKKPLAQPKEKPLEKITAPEKPLAQPKEKPLEKTPTPEKPLAPPKEKKPEKITAPEKPAQSPEKKALKTPSKMDNQALKTPASQDLSSFAKTAAPEAILQPLQPEVYSEATQAARGAQSFLKPAIMPLFTRMVGTIISLQQKGVSHTEILLNSQNFQNSPFFGTRIVFTQYSSAQNSYNIKMIGTPEAVTLFNNNFPSLMQAFKSANVKFKVNRLEAELETEKPLFKRKEPLRNEKEKGK